MRVFFFFFWQRARLFEKLCKGSVIYFIFIAFSFITTINSKQTISDVCHIHVKLFCRIEIPVESRRHAYRNGTRLEKSLVRRNRVFSYMLIFKITLTHNQNNFMKTKSILLSQNKKYRFDQRISLP